jgi:hypothetical protein
MSNMGGAVSGMLNEPSIILRGVSQRIPSIFLYQQHRLPLFSLQYPKRRWRGSQREGYGMRITR